MLLPSHETIRCPVRPGPPKLSNCGQERARRRQRVSPPKRPGGQSPGGQRSARLVHAGGRCNSRRPHQRRCRRHAHAGDVAWCGGCKCRGVSADLVAAFGPRSGTPFLCQGNGRPAGCAPRVPSLRDLQSTCTGRHARPGLRSTWPSLARAAPGAGDSAGRRFLPVWSAPLSRRFPDRVGGVGRSLAQGPRRSVRAGVGSYAGHLRCRRSLASSS